MNASQLEGLCTHILRSTGAEGVLMLVLHPGKRAEVVAALNEQADDLPAMVRRLADELESGSGVPTGNHLQTTSGKAVAS